MATDEHGSTPHRSAERRLPQREKTGSADREFLESGRQHLVPDRFLQISFEDRDIVVTEPPPNEGGVGDLFSSAGPRVGICGHLCFSG
jgi:hypothetical protein